MTECWLRSNRRVAGIGAVPPLVATWAGVALGAGWIGGPSGPTERAVGWGLTLLAGSFFAVWLLLVGWRPRLAYRDGLVLVYLRPYRPVGVPIEMVECFFMGQGLDPLAERAGKKVETANVVMRLAESATAWKRADVHPILGRWCDGYATIRGCWCEPLSVELVNQLNRRLKEAKRKQAQETIA